jgi:hypothetical protein
LDTQRSIGELIELLEHANPEALQQLRASYPREPILLGGALEGPGDTSLRARGEAARRAMLAYPKYAGAILRQLRSRLRLARRAELAGAAATAVASASIFVLLGKSDPMYLTIAASVSLLGVVANLIARHMQGDPVSGQSLAGWFSRLVQDEVARSRIAAEIDIELAQDELDANRIEGLVGRAESMSALANEIRAYLGA